jgi:guanosine-3',5'-bis(diphosphate) 3'-pyrophosphohydrolase
MDFKLEQAIEFAKDAHANQKYGIFPYFYHLDSVVSVLRRFEPLSQELEIAGYLHDVLEDTDWTSALISKMFGAEVAALVEAVTDERGSNRKMRKLATYPKTRAGGPDAVKLKLADRIANVEHCIEYGGTGAKFKMYRSEHADMVQYLDDKVHNQDMWKYLDSLFYPKDFILG